jgi:peroxiredoxin
MTKIYCTILCMLYGLQLFAQKAFQVNGQFRNAAHLKVFLVSDDRAFNDSTVTDANGQFKLKGKLAEPRRVYLRFEGHTGSYEFFGENANITLRGDANDLTQTETSGSREHKLFREIKQQEKLANDYLQSLQQPQLDEAMARKDTAAMIEIGTSSSFKWADSMNNARASFIRKHPGSAVSLLQMTYLVSAKPAGTMDTLMRLIERTPAGKYPYALKIRTLINNRMRVQTGTMAPDFSQPDSDGKSISLSGLRGKYVFIDFWASWCLPCRAENPNVLKAYNRFKDQNFTVMAVSLDNNREAWLKAIKEDQLPWMQLSDLNASGNAAAKLYGVVAIPSNFLVNPEGKIVAQNLRGTALEEALEKHLGQTSYQIKGQFKNAAHLKVYLKPGNSSSRDSAITDASGRFVFQGKVAEPGLFELAFAGRRGFYSFMVENTAITLSGNADTVYLSTATGSREQVLLTELKKDVELIGNYMVELQKPYHEAKLRNDTATMNAVVISSSMKWKDSLGNYQMRFISRYPNSMVAVMSMESLLNMMPVTTVDSVMRLIEQTPAGKYAAATKVRTLIDTRLSRQTGTMAPDFSQPDTLNRPVTLSSLRGKFVFIDFWASWCAPCRAENPNVLKAFNKFKDKNFTVLAISMDKNRDAWIRAIHEDALPWVQLSDLTGFDNAAGRLYSVTSIPSNFLVNPEGRIIAQNLRGAVLEEVLEKYVK